MGNPEAMGEAPELRTARLTLRRWRDSDRADFAAMNADGEVMEFFPRTLDRTESDEAIDYAYGHFERHGFGFWAVEAPGVAPFIGFVGLWVPRFDSPFTPCVEVGWRLARRFWGCGYATEAARASVDFGFSQLGLDEILAFTVPANRRSRAIMEKLGMTHDPMDDFDHPLIAEGHPLRRQVLYRLPRPRDL